MDEAADFQQEVVDLLEARDGHFLLESGHHGKLWLELDSLFARQARTAHFAAELARRLGSAGVEAVCGPLVGGALLAQAVGTQMDVDLLYTEAVGGGTSVPSCTGSATGCRRRCALWRPGGRWRSSMTWPTPDRRRAPPTPS